MDFTRYRSLESIRRRFMKKIVCTTNKRQALEALADKLRLTWKSPTYTVVVDINRNCVNIKDSTDTTVAIVYTGDIPVQKSGYKYRKATEDEIAKGEGLYVKESYQRNTRKQIPEIKEIDNVSNVISSTDVASVPLKTFKVGEKYTSTGLYGEHVSYEVMNRTSNTVMLAESHISEDDWSDVADGSKTYEIKVQDEYDPKDYHKIIGQVESVPIWEYHGHVGYLYAD